MDDGLSLTPARLFERACIEYALFVLRGCAAAIRVVTWTQSRSEAVRPDGSLKRIHFNVTYEVCTAPAATCVVDTVDFSVLYSVEILLSDPHRSGMHVSQKHLSVLDTYAARHPRQDQSEMGHYAALTHFIAFVLDTIGVPECFAEHFTITSINGVAQ